MKIVVGCSPIIDFSRAKLSAICFESLKKLKVIIIMFLVLKQIHELNPFKPTERKCQAPWDYLEEGVEDFEDLFLNEDRITGVIGEQLDEAFL